jgi:hypothetical protein
MAALRGVVTRYYQKWPVEQASIGRNVGRHGDASENPPPLVGGLPGRPPRVPSNIGLQPIRGCAGNDLQKSARRRSRLLPTSKISCHKWQRVISSNGCGAHDGPVPWPRAGELVTDLGQGGGGVARTTSHKQKAGLLHGADRYSPRAIRERASKRTYHDSTRTGVFDSPSIKTGEPVGYQVLGGGFRRPKGPERASDRRPSERFVKLPKRHVHTWCLSPTSPPLNTGM